MYMFVGKNDSSTINTFGSILAQYDFWGFCYNIVVDPVGYAFQNPKKAAKIKFDASHTIVALDETCREIHWEYFNNCINKKNFSLNVFCKQELWSLDEMLKSKNVKSEAVEKMFNRHNIKTIFIFYVPLSKTPGWHGEFVLFSSKTKAELEKMGAERLTELEDILSVFSSHFHDKYGRIINPVANLSCLSEKTLQVLSMLAMGEGIKEISEELYLTTRGVSYHIDKLKLYFGAKNIANIVDIAKNANIV